MRIAVTGANGHVGVNLCKALTDEGHLVNALVHKHANGLDGIPVHLTYGDVLDKKSLQPFMDGADIVFHLAARISITGDKNGMVLKTNGEGTQNMVDVARENNIRRFIHFSSIHAISQTPFGEMLDESRPLVGNKGFAYDKSKAVGEQAVLEAFRNGLDVVILSPTAIIGQLDFEPSLSGKAVIDIYKGRIPSLVPGGYDWVDVRDVVSSAVNAIENGKSGEKYLLSGHWHSLKEFSELIAIHSGRKTVDLLIPMWLAKVGLPFTSIYSTLSGTKPLYTSESLSIISEGNKNISHTKASQALQHKPRPLSDTIRDFIIWLKQTGRI